MSILPLQLDHVSFAASGKTLVDRLNLRLEAGPRTIVLGPNGAGKSLLLRLCHGLLSPTSGRVAWSGPDAPRRQAMVFQRPVLLRRSAQANVAYALALRGVGGAARRERAEAAIERFGLAAIAARSARVLSGGEQQRLALARAWAVRPEVLFLDEPTASLDPAATRAVEEALAAFAEDAVKIVMTTHDLGQARRLADEIVFLHKGRVVERSPGPSFFSAPASPEARAFLEGELLW
jgi:tungstate transport system ATP-binding protein